VRKIARTRSASASLTVIFRPFVSQPSGAMPPTQNRKRGPCERQQTPIDRRTSEVLDTERPNREASQ
jgi:hypothetical protein